MWIVDSYNSMEQQNGRNQCCICNPHTVHTSVKMTLNIKHFYSMARHIRISLHPSSPLPFSMFWVVETLLFSRSIFFLLFCFFFSILPLFILCRTRSRKNRDYVCFEREQGDVLVKERARVNLRSIIDQKDSKSKCDLGFCDVNLCFCNFI